MVPDRSGFAGLLERVLGPCPPAFALLHRPDAVGHRVELLTGDISEVQRIADVPLPPLGQGPPGPRHESLVLLPYRQLRERDFACHDDGTPLLAMTVAEQHTCPLDRALELLPDEPVELTDPGFDIDDDEYASIVRRVLTEEIGTGAGANFVIKRAFTARIHNWSARTALSLFRRLLRGERGAYWTFLVHTGERTLVGATPERHVSLFDRTVVMNPISGTLRHPPQGPTLTEVLEFLADPKEAGELYMVVDEELKMMARICEGGGRVVGPYLKQMATLAHTEYLIQGHSSHDVREILRETMFAPTVIGSPLENACRVIHSHEPRGRGYYSGAAALISRDINGGRSLDSAILLRTADITAGRLELGVGATLVRDSDPLSEAAETHAKARGMLRALGAAPTGPETAAPGDLNDHPRVRRALTARNSRLAAFWLDPALRPAESPDLRVAEGRRALIVDAEDTFTGMIAQQLRALGLTVDVRRFDQDHSADGYDLVVMGPGPGDPCDTGDPRIATLRGTIARLLADGTPFLAVCLSHQVLGTLLDLPVVRRSRPNQGVQKEIDFFGRRVLVGFYNTFALHAADDVLHHDALPGPVAVCRDPGTGQVHGLRGPAFASLQFHAESVLSRDGLTVLADLVADLTGDLTGDRPERRAGGSARLTGAVG
ncbi:anthranilate synthase family protein [Kitasatospora sp. NPDC001664]